MQHSPYRHHLAIASGAIAVGGIVVLFVGSVLFGAPEKQSEIKRFVVPIGVSQDTIFENLEAGGFVKNLWAFRLIHRRVIAPGGYQLSADMGAFLVSRVLKAEPYMKWVVIPEGLRKEEIADLLTTALGWSEEEKAKWIEVDTAPDFDHKEGVYFPDTYLISLEETPFDVAKRMRARFEEKFAPFAEEAINQDIKWTTALKLASIVQREAAGKSDMPLVAGILWNRLLDDMRLEVDATLQYLKGNETIGWWPKISPADKQIDSPYNSYKYAGLPPTPISNPGIEAIEAVLIPAETDCLFYLHDGDGEIHCAATYDEHLENIDEYLK